MLSLFEKAKKQKIEARGISDHDFIHSVYLRDPNGYVVELSTKQPQHDETLDPRKNDAREILSSWQENKNR